MDAVVLRPIAEDFTHSSRGGDGRGRVALDVRAALLRDRPADVLRFIQQSVCER